MRKKVNNQRDERCEERALTIVMGPPFTQAGSMEAQNFNRFLEAMDKFTAEPIIMIDFQDHGFNGSLLTAELSNLHSNYKNLDILLPVHGSEMTFIGNVTVLNPLVSIPILSDVLGDAIVNLPYTVKSEDFLKSVGDGLKYSLNQNPASIWYFGCQAAKLNPMAHKYFPIGTKFYTEGRSFLNHDIFLEAIIKQFEQNKPFSFDEFLETYYKATLTNQYFYYKLNNPTLQLSGGGERDALSSAQALFELIYENKANHNQLKAAMSHFTASTGLTVDNIVKFTRDLELKPVSVVDIGITHWLVSTMLFPLEIMTSLLSAISYYFVGESRIVDEFLYVNNDLHDTRVYLVSTLSTNTTIPNFGYCIDEIWQRTYLHWKYYDPVLSIDDRAVIQKKACLVSAFDSLNSDYGQVNATNVLAAYEFLAHYYFSLSGETSIADEAATL